MLSVICTSDTLLIAILYYDHLITLGDEYWRIWRNLRVGASWYFLLNRYFAFFAVGLCDAVSLYGALITARVVQNIGVLAGNFFPWHTEEVYVALFPLIFCFSSCLRGQS